MINKIIIYMYSLKIGFINKLILKSLIRNQLESILLRKIYYKLYNIEIGFYSYGCFENKYIPAGTKIGRYCSFGPDIKIFNANHPLNYLSLHPYLYNPVLGIVNKETISRTKLVIGDDVWIGANAIILPSVKKIGTGAVIGAGSIVTKDVPDFAVVVGSPAQIIKYRFDENIQSIILRSKIFKKNKNDFAKKITFMYNKDDFFKLLESKENEE